MLNYKQFGSGFPLVILHGMFGTLDNWQTIAKQLAEEYLVFIVDQRNHGRSPHIDGAFDYAVLAEDLKVFMEENYLYQAHLLGHSMGGKTVMQFALEYPDMVEKLIVADIAPKTYPGGHTEVFEALFAVPVATLEGREQALSILREHLPGDETTVQFLMKNLSRKPEGGFEWKMNVASIYESYDAILGDVTAPGTFMGETLFLRGGRSNYVQQDDMSLILNKFPNAQLQTIDGAGHWLHAEKPEEFVVAARAFLG